MLIQLADVSERLVVRLENGERQARMQRRRQIHRAEEISLISNFKFSRRSARRNSLCRAPLIQRRKRTDHRVISISKCNLAQRDLPHLARHLRINLAPDDHCPQMHLRRRIPQINRPHRRLIKMSVTEPPRALFARPSRMLEHFLRCDHRKPARRSVQRHNLSGPIRQRQQVEILRMPDPLKRLVQPSGLRISHQRLHRWQRRHQFRTARQFQLPFRPHIFKSKNRVARVLLDRLPHLSFRGAPYDQQS